MRRVTALAAAALVAAAAAPAGAQEREPNVLTPDGPATLQQRYLGPVPAIACAPGPYVLTSWSVRVGPGGRAGRVALRVPGRSAATPAVTLPATPGVHRFPVRVRSGCALPSPDLALVQESGGHAVLFRHPDGDGGPGDPGSLWRLDVFRAGAPTERLRSVELLAGVEIEADLDADLRGDRTQDRDGFGSRALGLAVPLRVPVALRSTRAGIRVPVRSSRARRVTVTLRGEASSGDDGESYVATRRVRVRRGVTRVHLPPPESDDIGIVSATVASRGLRPVTAGFVILR